MKKLFYFICLFFIACGNQQEVNDAKVPASKIDSLKQVVDSPKIVRNIKFDSVVNPDSIPYHGKLKTAVEWEDANGKNILIICERPQYFWADENPSIGKYCQDDEDSEVAELFAWHYLFNEKEKKWKVYWHLNDFIFGNSDVEMEYLTGTLSITDLDHNGIAESIFTYNTSEGDGPIDNGWDGKMILHIDTVKYSLKGPIGNTSKDLRPDAAKPVFSKNYVQLDSSFTNYSMKMWKRSEITRDSLYAIFKKSFGE
jgi:hypothetical protein